MKKHLITYSLVCLGAAALAQSDRIPSRTDIMVRTSENIEADAPSDYRIYRGTVDRERDRWAGDILSGGIQVGLTKQKGPRDASRTEALF